MAEFNIGAISLVYSSSNIVDKYGSAFEYVSVLNPDAHTKPWKMRQSGHVCCDEHQKSTTDKRQIFDVFLVGTDK